jgi:hypothetical protein
MSERRKNISVLRRNGFGSVRNFVCKAGDLVAPVLAFSPRENPTMRVGAVGNRVLCGFPSPCGRVLCVHRDGSVHALCVIAHFTRAAA